MNEHILKQGLVISFLFCVHFFAFTQEKSTKVIFEVVDENGILINDVYLVEDSSQQFLGATSNGRLELISTENELNLRFSHLSYENSILKLEGIFKQDSIFKKVVLQSKSFGIETVNISAELNPLAYKNEVINVMDYVFYNNSILMLCGLGKNKQLRLASGEGYDITSMFLPKGAKQVFKDCLNNIFLLYKDSVYLVKFTDTSLLIVDPYSRFEFDKTAGICEAAIGENIIIGKVGEHGQEVNFFLKPEGTTQYTLLKTILNYKDQAIEKSFKLAYERQRGDGLNSGSAETVAQLSTARNLDRAYTYYKYVLSSRLYSPIFKIKNQFVLFNTFQGFIEWYSPKGDSLKELKIDFLNQENWANLMLYDAIYEEVYVFKTNGPKKYLQSLDINTGELGNSIYLERHPFAENYQVKNGYVYYLYREDHRPGLPQKLYKHKL